MIPFFLTKKKNRQSIFSRNKNKLLTFLEHTPWEQRMQAIGQEISGYWFHIKSIGITPGMEEYEKRKMSIFNQLNFLGIISGIIVPVIAVFSTDHLPPLAWFVACSPAAISFIVLWLNYERYYELSRVMYFSLYPIATCLVYLGKVDVGIELFYIMYGVLSVFFLQQVLSIIFSFSLSIACYFLSAIMFHDYYFRLELVNYGFYVFNHLLAIVFIFYGLYLVKKENTGYQFSILYKSRELHRRNLEIESQQKEITEKGAQLELKNKQLMELNQVKNKMFSVIAHDLKTPMYALRNLFQNIHQADIPAEEIKELIPGITNEMNYTTSLMENLLQWAKNQMRNSPMQPEVLDVQAMIDDVMHLLHLQASNKQIYLESRIEHPLYCFADREMVKLVLRNLVSNAIKFTPENGKVIMGANAKSPHIEIFVQDTGIGISSENIQRLFGDLYFTTRGTNDEGGTGLGLKLCKEFLEKNGGRIYVTSEPGEGSTFSFTLPQFDNA
jgi:two-component system sensor histidine kinase/response regulator